MPEEVRMFENCKIFDRGRNEDWKMLDIGKVTVGEMNLDENEISILKLNPKFAVLKRLDDEIIERDIE